MIFINKTVYNTQCMSEGGSVIKGLFYYINAIHEIAAQVSFFFAAPDGV